MSQQTSSYIVIFARKVIFDNVLFRNNSVTNNYTFSEAITV